MPILMANDAGLPLGTGFDGRKPEQIEKAAPRHHGGIAANRRHARVDLVVELVGF